MSRSKGRFGIHGGQYIPETLMNAVIELEKAYEHYKDDPDFNRELTALLNEYAGRPSLLYYAEKLTRELGGAKIYLKREDLNHTGSHKINNVLVRLCWLRKWERPALSLKQAPVSTELLRLLLRLCWTWSAWYSWARRTLSVRLSTFTE